MKPFNLFWIGIGFWCLSGITDQIELPKLAMSLLCSGLAIMIVAGIVGLQKY